MLKKIFIATALFSLFVFSSFAQIPSPLIFNRITKEDGLASNMTFQTLRDKQGFLWIATQNGLQRHDGNRFLTFRHIPGDRSSIPENTINHLFIDSKERLWILCDKQAGLFNTTRFRFSGATIDSSVVQIKKIMEDGEGRIILFADSRQFVYDERQHSFASAYLLPALPQGYSVGDMAIDPSTGLYWCTGKQGSLVYDPKTKQFKDGALDSLGRIKNARYPFITKDGVYWMVNWIPFSGPAPVLYSYNKKKNLLQRFEKIRPYTTTDTYYEIWNVFQQSDGATWIYGMGLLAYYSTEEKRFIHINSNPFQQNGIDYDMVSNLYEDKEKNVWVCTNKGVYRFNTGAQVFRNIPNKRINDTALIHNSVSAVIQTKQHDIWVSTWGAGIFSYNEQWQPIPNPLTGADPLNRSLHASAMMQRRNGEIWIGLQTGALKIYDPVSQQIFSLAHRLLKGEIIQQLFEDRQGNTWIGSSTGLLVKCENSNWKDSTRFTTMLSEAGDIYKLYQDSIGHLWVCTATTGVYEMDISNGHIRKQFKETGRQNDGLLNDGATDIVQYNDSIYIIASDGLCILNNKTNTFSYLTAAEGLPAEHITGLVVDKQKRLWVACDGGLYRLNIHNKLFVTYDAADGITNDIFQVSSPTVLQDGRIAIGTPGDLLVFDPEKTIDRKQPPAVTITGFVLGTARLSVDSLQQLEKVILSHDNTFTRIELSTLSFRDQYYMYYMLDGLDKTWKRVYNNEITYQVLPPGDYTLKLKSQNGEGAESATITMLQIEVKPPFWKTWWFYSLLVLLTGGLLFWLDNQRIKRKTAVLEMRSHIADGLHQDINEALSNITILSEMAKLKADREPEKSKEFIEQIHTKSQNMTVAMDDILWSIDPNNDSMENFMLRFREYIDALKNRYDVQIDVLVDKKAERLQLKMNRRNNIFWLFKGGITNVVKTGAQNCRIHITYEKPNLIYTLEFDTAAMDLEQLHNLRQRNELADRLEELHAKLDFKEHSTGAVFVLNIPVKREGL